MSCRQVGTLISDRACVSGRGETRGVRSLGGDGVSSKVTLGRWRPVGKETLGASWDGPGSGVPVQRRPCGLVEGRGWGWQGQTV